MFSLSFSSTDAAQYTLIEELNRCSLQDAHKVVLNKKNSTHIKVVHHQVCGLSRLCVTPVEFFR